MKLLRIRGVWLTLAALSLSLAWAGCGAEEPPPATPTLAPTHTAPAATPTLTPMHVSPTPTPTLAARAVGEVDSVVFAVGEGSEATFTVREQLANLPLPNDAVMRTTGLSGEVRLDGGASEVSVDLQSMTSDSSQRDGYVRLRMFANQTAAVVTFGDLRPLPEGFLDGAEVSTSATGELSINGATHTLPFTIEARDDGEMVYVVGRATFTWTDIGMPPPSARIVVSVEDEVRVEVLLALRPA